MDEKELEIMKEKNLKIKKYKKLLTEWRDEENLIIQSEINDYLRFTFY